MVLFFFLVRSILSSLAKRTIRQEKNRKVKPNISLLALDFHSKAGMVDEREIITPQSNNVVNIIKI